jgi:hypothetical protein
MPWIEPSAEKLQQFVADANDESPIVMINLLRYRDRAEYPKGSEALPCSGREAYQRYGLSWSRCSVRSAGKFSGAAARSRR